jgi:hypothetical protein
MPATDRAAKAAQIRERWNQRAALLQGRTIIRARYMTPAETQANNWLQSPILLELDDGTFLTPSSDDEGNAAGTLFVFPGAGSPLPEGFPVL